MALDVEHARGVVELLGHVLADAFHRAAAGAGGVLGLVPDLGPRQGGWQRGALRDVLDRCPGLSLLECLQLQTDGLEVGLDGLLEQVALLAVELFAAGRELPAFEDRHLVREMVDLELLAGVVLTGVGKLAPGAAELVAGVGDLADQLGGELTQFICVHPGQLIGRVHGQGAATLLNVPKDRRYAVRITASLPTRCHGRPITSACNCSVVIDRCDSDPPAQVNLP